MIGGRRKSAEGGGLFTGGGLADGGWGEDGGGDGRRWEVEEWNAWNNRVDGRMAGDAVMR